MGRFRKIQYSLVFNRKGKLNRFGEGLIQIRAYQNPKSRYFSTDVYIQPKHWDERNKKVRHNHPNQFVYNQRIIDLVHTIEQFEIKMINQYGSFPLDRLQEYKKAIQQNIHQNFTAFFHEELEHSGLVQSTLKSYRYTLKKLKQFQETIYFEDMDYSLIRRFDRFLIKQGLGLNTVKKHHDRVKTMINVAIRMDLLPIENNPYKKFKAKTVEPQRVFLSTEELKRIEQLTFSEENKHLDRVKDMFLLCSYTGLRFTDVSKLSFSKIAESRKGLEIDLRAQKTKKRLRLPLYSLFRVDAAQKSKPETIIWKYHHELSAIGDPWKLKGFQFFNVTNQYFNRALKDIAVLAGIDKKLSSHCARRTFACIMATKVKAPVLQRLLQHSSPDMTNIYIQLSNESIENELRKIETWE